MFDDKKTYISAGLAVVCFVAAMFANKTLGPEITAQLKEAGVALMAVALFTLRLAVAKVHD